MSYLKNRLIGSIRRKLTTLVPAVAPDASRAQPTPNNPITDIALRESEARYRLIAENSNDIISVQLPNGILTYISPSCQHLLGYTPEEMLGRSFHEFIHSDDVKRLEAGVSSDQGFRSVSVATYRVRHKDGHYLWLESAYRVIQDEGTGAPQHIVATSRDIGERMEAQLALQRSEEQFRSLIASMDDLVFSLDLHGRFLVYHYNQTSFYNTPITQEAYIGKHYQDVLPAELATQLDALIPIITSTLETRQLEYSLHTDGNERYFNARLTPMIGSRIELLGVTFIAREVTDAVQARLRQQHMIALEQFHLAVAAKFLQAKDTDAVMQEILADAGKFLDLSHASVFRFRHNERLMDNTHEWCAPGITSEQANLQGIAQDELMPSFFPMLANGGIMNAEHLGELPPDVAMVLKSQNIKSSLGLPFFVNERLEGFIRFDEMRHPRRWQSEEIATLRAVADSYARALERQQSEYELIQARDAALHSAKLKGEFMSNMSHEIRTPMTGVIGMLELLRESNLNEDQAEFVEIAHTSARRLMRLLDDILDFSKIEAGKVTLETIPVDLRGLLAEVEASFTAQAAKKHIQLSTDVDSAVPARVLGDSTRLRQVLANLVSNAIKFTEQGQIEIVLRQVSSAQGRSRLRFEVHDTGIGIPEEQLKNIFNSFVQADSSMTRRYGGTGLGLAICHQLVSLMGGSIAVKSTVGQGSAFRFTVTMPVVTLNERLPANAMLSQIQALVIDDESTARYVLAQQLRKWGLSVIETANLNMGEALLLNAATRSEEVDIVFLRPNADADVWTHWLRQVREKLGYLAPHFVLIVDQQPNEVTAFDSILKRPIRLSDLYNIVIRNASGDIPDVKPPEGDGFMMIPQAGRILLAEDDSVNWKIAVRALSQLGYVVDVAHDGAEAVSLVQQHPYALVLMDIHMPNMDGLEATRRIRSLQIPFCKVPIVALTASVLNEEQQSYSDAGMDDFLAKPFSVEQLRATVQQWANTSSGTHILHH